MGKEADILAKIVVVEDDVYMREELLNLLEKSGYDTIGLSDFENAVSEIAAYFPDLILLDINLPFRSGFEICKELKAKQIGTVYYFFTTFESKNLSGYKNICEFLPIRKMPEKPVNTGYTGI